MTEIISNEPKEGEEIISLTVTTPIKVDPIRTILIPVGNTKDSDYVTDWLLLNLLKIEDIKKQKIVLLGVKEPSQSSADEYLVDNLKIYEILDKKMLAWYSETLHQHKKKILEKYSEADVEMFIGEGIYLYICR
jgi:predicted RNA-binding protein with PUA domain